MTKAPPKYSPVTCNLRNEDELPVLLEMMRAGGYASYETVVRAALYKHARHLGLDVPRRIFSLTEEPEVSENPTPCHSTP